MCQARSRPFYKEAACEVHQQVYQLMTGILATADENAIAEGRQQTVNSTIVVSIGDAVGKTPPEASHTEEDDDSTQARPVGSLL